jgi:hypothetical protein
LNGTPTCITPNLTKALYHIRSAGQFKPQTLWVDAVCINQEDVDERSSQVALMRYIYGSAKAVTIWLGEDSEELREMFDGISVLAASDDSNDRVSGRLELARKHTSALLELNQRPWFGRMWILQELALASQDPTVLCGQSSAPWSRFVAAWKFIAKGLFTEIGMTRTKPPEPRRPTMISRSLLLGRWKSLG